MLDVVVLLTREKIDCPESFDPYNRPMHIDAYRFGKITIDETEYTDDLIITPSGVRSGWWRREGHAVTLFDLGAVLDPRPAKLIIGTGASGQCAVRPEVEHFCREMGIALFAAPTPEAVVEYNTLSDEEKAKTVCALHLTC